MESSARGIGNRPLNRKGIRTFSRNGRQHEIQRPAFLDADPAALYLKITFFFEYKSTSGNSGSLVTGTTTATALLGGSTLADWARACGLPLTGPSDIDLDQRVLRARFGCCRNSCRGIFAHHVKLQ